MADSVDDFLAHYGKKGMKWGHRKAAKAERKAEKKAARDEEDRQIVGARIRNEKRAADLNKKAAATYTATTKKGLAAAEDAYAKAEKKHLSHPDAEMSRKMTSGEKKIDRIQMGLSLGVIGLAIGAAALSAHG